MYNYKKGKMNELSKEQLIDFLPYPKGDEREKEYSEYVKVHDKELIRNYLQANGKNQSKAFFVTKKELKNEQKQITI